MEATQRHLLELKLTGTNLLNFGTKCTDGLNENAQATEVPRPGGTQGARVSNQS